MKRVLLVLVASTVALLSCASTVLAASAFERVGSFAEAFPDGQAAHQKRIAVNHTSGAVYVTDVVNDRIAVYTPNDTSADLLTTFGAGDVTDPFGIAVDDATGDVYVSDDDDVIKYTSDGAPVPTFTKDNTFASPGVTGPLAFDQAADELLVADRAANRIRRYSTAGVAGPSFDGSAGAGAPGPFAGLQDLAVDSTGDIVVVDATGDPAQGAGTSSVLRYSGAGSFEAVIGPVPGAATVTIRPSDDDVIVSGEQDAVMHNEKPTLRGFTAAGVPTMNPALDASTIYSTISGMASGAGAAGRLFVATDVDAAYGGSFGLASVQVYRASTITAPAISGVAAEASESNVRFSARIATSSAATTYRIQLGTSAAYGTDLPATGPAEIAGSFTPTAIAQQALSLAPSTAYHYRVTATNLAGTTTGGDRTFTTSSGEVAQGDADSCPNAAVRAQQHAAALPDCRAYEQVSPVDKNGSPVFYFPDSHNAIGATFVARNGSAAIFSAVTPFANSTHGVFQTQRSQRGPDGWETTVVSPAPTIANPGVFNGAGGMWVAGSPDATKGITLTSNAWDPLDTNVDQDIYALDAHGTPTLASAAPDGTPAGEPTQANTAISDNGSVVFPAMPALVPEDTTPGVLDLYERVGGTTRLVGVAPGGGLASPCGSSLTGGYQADVSAERGPATRVSADGSHIVFQTPGDGYFACPDPRHLYVRIDGTRTLDVSASHRTVPDPTPADATFVAMSDDGVRILFTSPEMLTNDAPDPSNPTGALLYEYRTDTEQLSYLGLDGPGGESAADVVAFSRDGARLYFVSYSAMAPGATDGVPNLYVRFQGQITWIASPNPDPGGWASQVFTGTLSPDGRSFLFGTSADLGVADGGGVVQAYLHRDGQSLRCVSCPAGSLRPTSDVRIANGSGWGGGNARGVYASSLSDDGSRVVFDTSDPLSPADANNSRDVYEWHDGKVSLLSGAQLGRESYVLGLSGSGRDVFMGTSGSLAPTDVDGDLDVYDARIDGGFLQATSAAGKPCIGDECQGAAAAAPAAATPGSAGLAGRDAPSGPVRVGGAPAKVTAAAKKTVKGPSGSVAVKVSRKGRIRASGAALASTTKAASKAGTYAVKVALSAAGRRALARQHRVTVAVTVRFTPDAGAAKSVRVRVTFTTPPAAQHRVARRATAPATRNAR